MKKLVIPLLVISALVGLWFWSAPQSSEGLVEPEILATDQSTVATIIDNSSATNKKEIKHVLEKQAVDETDMDEDYIEYVLDYETPVAEALLGLIKLSNQGNGDALLALLARADECRYQEDKLTYCPGEGLAGYGAGPGARNSLVRNAAESGSLMAMTLLIDTFPAPFMSLKDFRENNMRRAKNADIVALNNALSRDYLEYAAQSGFPPALRRSAELYAYGSIVDPDAEKAAFYTLASYEISGVPIPNHMQTLILDPMEINKYNRILKRAENFAAQFKDK